MSPDEAIELIVSNVGTPATETVAIDEAPGRITAADVKARMTQPPFDASAMDGYAVRFAEARIGARLPIIAEARAGEGATHILRTGETLRVFTGSVMPEGADHVVIQEHVRREGECIVIEQKQAVPRHIRKAGIDFHQGQTLIEAGRQMHEIHSSLLAAANIDAIAVTARPTLALFSCGDELIEPGATPMPGQIVNSNHYALSALARKWGAQTSYLGCARDNQRQIATFFSEAKQADIILVTGGASVGDHDYVKPAFKDAGGAIIFSQLALRPGKPTWFGRIDAATVLGLPGNPASAIVAAALSLRPLILAMSGQAIPEYQTTKLGVAMPANGKREHWMRAVIDEDVITPVTDQDSSLLSPFSTANALLRRKADAPPAQCGDQTDLIRLW